VLAMDWEGKQGSSIEAIAYLDGAVLAGLDQFHHTALLPAAAHTGTHDLLIRYLAPVAQRFGGLSVQLRDPIIFRLGHTIRAQLEAVGTFQESDLGRHAVLKRLNAAYNTLDLREGWGSQRFADSARAALEGLEKDTPNSQIPTPTIVATGHAHLDVGWLWPVWRTRQKVAHTVATALHLMERYPDYRFSMSQPQVYHFLKHDAPDLYERMKARIAEGRFEPVGMMWLETDCNIPSGESLVRQLAHGARFFAEEFPEQYGPGSDPNFVVWLPDVFGYSAALPQLMRGCGIASFMTTKISWNQFNRMPNDTFRWRGIDGSEVLTHFVTASDKPLKHWAEAQFYTYNGMMTGTEAFGTWQHYRQKAISDEVLYIFGYGDGGGGPTEEMLEAASALDQLPGYPNIKLGRIDEFFAKLYERAWNDPRLPTWAGELYLEYHRGTYTSQSRTKQANRAAELMLREAEWLNAWAVARGAENQQAQIDAAWQLLLLQQFHDILPGSSIPQVYIDSNAHFAEIQQIGCTLREAAANEILTKDQGRTTNPSTDERSVVDGLSSLVVWNSLPWERHECAEIALSADGAAPPERAQIVEEADGTRVALVEATLPAYSYTTLNISADKPDVSTTASSKLIAQKSKLENSELRLELNEHGEIASLYDLRHNRETIAPNTTANQLVIYEDRPLFWDAWDIDIFYEEKPYPVHEIVDWRVTEEGPLRSAITITRRVGQSTITQRIQMWRDSRRIDFVTEVDWKERQTLLRALFPLNLNANRATCEIQFGAVERPTHRNTSWDWARFEVCAHRWVDLSEGGYGVALLNNGKYGHSLNHNTIGLSLLKGAIAPAPDADMGRHHFTYSLLPHAGDWREAEMTRRAYELNAPLFVTKDERRKTNDSEAASSLGLRPSSFVNTSTNHIVVETVKVAHDGDGLIVRLYEAHNQRGQATLEFGQPISSAVEVDLLEREVGAVEISGNQARFQVRPFEVKTLRVRLG
jgi:alpha-mannosidase